MPGASVFSTSLQAFLSIVTTGSSSSTIAALELYVSFAVALNVLSSFFNFSSILSISSRNAGPVSPFTTNFPIFKVHESGTTLERSPPEITPTFIAPLPSKG